MKLSPAQRNVLEKMRDGWTFRMGRQFAILEKGIDRENVSGMVKNNLFNRGYISRDWSSSKYDLTESGKQAVK